MEPSFNVPKPSSNEFSLLSNSGILNIFDSVLYSIEHCDLENLINFIHVLPTEYRNINNSHRFVVVSINSKCQEQIIDFLTDNTVFYFNKHQNFGGLNVKQILTSEDRFAYEALVLVLEKNNVNPSVLNIETQNHFHKLMHNPGSIFPNLLNNDQEMSKKILIHTKYLIGDIGVVPTVDDLITAIGYKNPAAIFGILTYSPGEIVYKIINKPEPATKRLPLHYMLMYYKYQRADPKINKFTSDVIEKLLDSGADPNKRQEYSSNAEHESYNIEHQHPQTFCEIIIEIHERTNYGENKKYLEELYKTYCS